MIWLGPEWTELLESYERNHTDPRNAFCHDVGIPLNAASLPVALVGLGLPLAVSMLFLGVAFQLAGHGLDEGGRATPEDPRHLVVSLVWWLERRGASVRRTAKSEAEAEK